MALRLVAEVGLDGAGFERGLNRIGASAAANLKSFVVGAFGIAAIQQAITKTVESCTELVNASSKLGVTVEQLQVMRQAAKEGGIEFDRLVSSANKLAAIRGNIIQGGKGAGEQRAALQRLGVTPDQIRNMTGMQMMMGPIASKVNQVNPADIANDLKIVFGRAFGEIIPVLKTDFGSLEAKMRSFGIIIDGVTAREVKAFGDQLGLIAGVMTTSIAPWLVELGRALFGFLTGVLAMDAMLGTAFADIMAGHWKDLLVDVPEAGQEVLDSQAEIWAAFEDRIKNPPPIPPPTIPPELPQPKEKAEHLKEWKTPSDALISVGNFLGAGRGAIGNVAQQHLEVARSSLTRLESIDTKLDKLEDVGGWDDLDTGN